MPEDREFLGLGGMAIAPGVWRVAMRFPSPMKYSFAYFVQVDDGWIAVDLGWDSDENWSTFVGGLQRAGGSLDRLVGVVITHAHPDHYGLAGRVRAHTDAWIAMHPAERPQISPEPDDRSGRIVALERWLARCGVPDGQLEHAMSDRERLLGEFATIIPDVDQVSGPIPGSQGRLEAIHTPGHAPGHLMFVDRATRVHFTGDHLLPRVSVNVSLRPTSDPDPLQDYLDSLGKLRDDEPRMAAPGHEWSFDRVPERIAVVEQHHQERLDEVEDVVSRSATTTWDVTRNVTWARPFESLNARAVRSALGETAAHLARLEGLGRAQRSVENGIVTWSTERRH